MPSKRASSSSLRILAVSIVDPVRNRRTQRFLNLFENLGWKVDLICPNFGVDKENRRPVFFGPMMEKPFAGLYFPARRFLIRILFLLGAWGMVDLRELARISSSILGLSTATDLILKRPDVIFTQDVYLLPALSERFSGVPILFDLRDLTHRLNEQNPIWRATFGRGLKAMMASYLPCCANVFTVSEGLARTLDEDFGVTADVVLSVPDQNPASPLQFKKAGSKEFVYSGKLDSNRGVLRLSLIFALFLREANLNLILVGSRLRIAFYSFVLSPFKNVRLVRPVMPGEAVSLLMKFDFGISLFPPKTKNLKFAMPNKFFEYLLAGLPVIVAANSEMAGVVQKFGCGVTVGTRTISEIRNGVLRILRLPPRLLQSAVANAVKAFVWADEEAKVIARLQTLFYRP